MNLIVSLAAVDVHFARNTQHRTHRILFWKFPHCTYVFSLARLFCLKCQMIFSQIRKNTSISSVVSRFNFYSVSVNFCCLFERCLLCESRSRYEALAISRHTHAHTNALLTAFHSVCFWRATVVTYIALFLSDSVHILIRFIIFFSTIPLQSIPVHSQSLPYFCSSRTYLISFYITIAASKCW